MDRLLFDDEYTGKRWRYGLTYRPVSNATVPKDWIIGSARADERFAHGTLDFPRELSAREIAGYQLTPIEP